MLVLLPPSEGKTPPRSGRPVDLDTLSFPGLTPVRRTLLTTLVDLARSEPEATRRALGLSPAQADEVARDARLPSAPTAAAGRIYTGVLYDALDLRSLPAPAQRRARSALVVASALFGAVRIGDRIPAYRLPAGVRLPGLGPVNPLWRAPLAAELPTAVGRGLLLDLRSSGYAALWQPSGPLAERTVTVRVLHEQPDGTRTVVSHFNKATKGRLVRALLLAGERPRDVDALVALLARLGYHTERGEPAAGKPHRLDVVVTQV